MRARHLFTAALALVATASIPTTAKANDVEGFAVDHFDPSERGSEWFSADTLDIRGNGRLAIGLPTSWSYRNLVLYGTDASGNEVIRDSIVRNLVVTNPGLSVVLFDRLRLGASFPIALFVDGHTGNTVEAGQAHTYNSSPNEQAIGDLRFAADLRLVGTSKDEFTLAVGAAAYLPTGDKTAYMSDGEFRIQPRIQIAGEIGSFMYAVKLGYMYRGRNELYAGSPLGSEFTYGGAIGLRLADKLVIGPEIYGSTVVDSAGSVSDAFGKRTTPLEGLLGLHYSVGDIRLGAGIGAGLTRGYGAPAVRGLFNIEYAPGVEAPKAEPTDRDKDGILDQDDACPDTAGVKTDDPKTNGCPPSDKDGDGILDKDDACVDVAGVASEDPKQNGCPSDKDKDGIYDSVDACPDVPGVKSDDPKKNGCPSDRDGDGVLDADDACPDAPGLKTSDPKTNGCPDPDRDKDGINNDQDACPDEPGKADPDPKRNGCPKAFVKDGQIKILDQVKFKTGSAEILKGKDSDEVLQAVVKILQSHVEIVKVKVEGHTDNKGNAKANKTLSGNRAKSVVAWLVKNGVAKDRLTSEGFGQERPIDTNNTEDGRKNNRRVEFHIDGPADSTVK